MLAEHELPRKRIEKRIGQINRALELAQTETTLPRLVEHFPTDPNPNAEPLSELLAIHEVISRRSDYKSGIKKTVQRLKELRDEQERSQVPYALENLASLMRDGLVTPEETRRIGKITEGLVNISPMQTSAETAPEVSIDSHASRDDRQDGLTTVDSHHEPATSKPAESNEYTKPNLLTDRERRFLDFVEANQKAGIPLTTRRGIQYMWPDETITPNNLKRLSTRFSVFLSTLRQRDDAPELITNRQGKGSEAQYILKNLGSESETHASSVPLAETAPDAGIDSHASRDDRQDGLAATEPARTAETVIHQGEKTLVITKEKTPQKSIYEMPTQKITLPADALKIIRLLSRSSQENPKPLRLSEDARAQMTELLKGTPITICTFEKPDGNTDPNMFYLEVAEGHKLTNWVNIPPPTAVEEAEMVGIISSRTAPAFDQIHGASHVLTPEKAKDIPRITMNTQDFTISVGNKTRKIYHARVVQLIQRLQVLTGKELTIDDLAGDNASDRDREIAHGNFIQLQRDFEDDPRNPKIFITRKDSNGFRFQVNAVIIP